MRRSGRWRGVRWRPGRGARPGPAAELSAARAVLAAALAALAAACACAGAPPPAPAPVTSGAYVAAVTAAPPATAAPGTASAKELLLPPGTAAAVGPTPVVVHRAPGMFGEVLVVDEGDLRSLRFGDVDGDDQSTISLSDPAAVPMEYVRYAALGLLYVAHPKRALVVGLGGGTFPALLRRALPDLRIDAVEIDPAVIDAAKKFFAVREDARYVIHLGDGRAFVEHAKTRWDLVLLDAYGGDGVPAPLATREFFAAVRARLAPGGAVVANLFSHDPAGERSLVATFAAVFPSIACFRTPDRLNRVLIGRADAKPGAPPTPAPTYDRDALAARAKDLGARLKLSFDLADPAARVGTGCEALDFTAPVLRDAPRVAP